MIKRFSDKPLRLQNWDYGSNAYYFVTICTKDQKYFFGHKSQQTNSIVLSPAGEIAGGIWKQIPDQFNFVELDRFVVMPNHVHGIIRIAKSKNKMEIDRRAINRAPNKQISSEAGGITGEKNPMLHDNLSRIIRWYKGRVSFEIHQRGLDFQWQPRFHSSVIKDKTALARVGAYVENNPRNWSDDPFFLAEQKKL